MRFRFLKNYNYYIISHSSALLDVDNFVNWTKIAGHYFWLLRGPGEHPEEHRCLKWIMNHVPNVWTRLSLLFPVFERENKDTEEGGASVKCLICSVQTVYLSASAKNNNMCWVYVQTGTLALRSVAFFGRNRDSEGWT